MANQPHNLYVSVAEPVVVVKINGRANFAISVHFETLVSELMNRGYRRFLLELQACNSMDSTFLGVLAGLALNLSEFPPEAGAGMELLNPSPRILELLENLGVARLFPVRQGAVDSAAEAGTPVPVPEVSREKISRTVLEAHQLLMDLNPANVPKFKEVTQFLAEDLKKLKPKE